MLARHARTIDLLIYLAIFVGLLAVAWTTLNNYYLRVLSVIGINIILTVSLNIINGWLGEFSCSHPGFMAVGVKAAAFGVLLRVLHTGFSGAPELTADGGALEAGGLCGRVALTAAG